jgi:DNA-binding protein HU-beta
MNRADLINKVAEDAGISKAAAAKAITAVTEGIMDGLNGKDGKVSLIGFGTFTKVHREARTGRNPQTGDTITIAARNVVKFVPGKKLKESI